jgi:hypothetical protein
VASRPAKRVPVLCVVVEAVARGGWTEVALYVDAHCSQTPKQKKRGGHDWRACVCVCACRARVCVCACLLVCSRCLTDVLVIALMPEPMPAGTYVDELEAENPASVPVLRQLAHDPRFERAWPLWRRYPQSMVLVEKSQPTDHSSSRSSRQIGAVGGEGPAQHAGCRDAVCLDRDPTPLGRPQVVRVCVCACVCVRVCVCVCVCACATLLGR